MSSNLTADILFPNKVWRQELGYDSNSIIPYIKELHANSPTVVHSNYGGWQSPPLDNDTVASNLSELKSKIDSAIKEVCKDTLLPELYLDNLWFNVNPPGTYNIIHTHPGAVISGVYYIDVPAENMGNIRFYRDDAAEYYMPDNCTGNNNFTSLSVEYPPKKDLLLLFPSWLKHSVQGNLSNENRISMSFNYGVVR
jgi:uncharacterized protein (TIGR02466 family)